jgi:Txe/YoeB family toxin of Txe-Axe toxin-antitoxin module
MKKPSRVVFISDELETAYEALPEDELLKKAIKRAVADLQENAFCATQIPKRLFPKEYVKTYGITNLWKYDLPRGWRLLYTVTAENEVELISAILEWSDHKAYEKRFKY